MPLELPGFYFDVARNRYFPVNSPFPRSTPPSAASTPAAQETLPPNEGNTGGKIVSKDRNTKLKRDLMTALGSGERWNSLHMLQASNLAHMVVKSSSVAPYDSLGIDLTSLAVSGKVIFAGDKRGMLYFGSSEEPNAPWSLHFHLESQITSVHAHHGTTYAASLGPNPQILITTDDYTARFSMHAFHDVWTVHWITSDLPLETADATTSSVGSAVLGMKQRAVYMPSLETHRGCYIMPTNSDVFAVHKHHSQILTGARNGSVKLFDIRAPPQSHCTIFQPCVRTGRTTGGAWDLLNVPSSQQRRTPSPSKSMGYRPNHGSAPAGHTSAVTNLRVVHEWGLLLGSMDGTLAVYDIRFCGAGSYSTQSRSGPSEIGSPRPVLTLPGHVNTHSQDLGFCVDPSSNFVFAAGEDKRVRAWSLKTGDPVFPVTRPNMTNDASQPPGQAFSGGDRGLLSLKKFPRPINALVLSNSGIDLWAATGRDLFCFESSLPIV